VKVANKAWDVAMGVLRYLAEYLITRIFHIHMESNLTLRDCVLAIIKLGSSRDGEFRYKTKIHKILFILAQEFEELGWLRNNFIPYHFGPWSYDVEFKIRELVRLGFLEEKLDERDEIDGLRHTGYVYAYRLTRAGRVLAEDAVKKLSPKIKKRIKELLKLNLWTLIGYVYVRYPEYATRSVLADDELMPRRREILSTV
jgi:hypothetical protein